MLVLSFQILAITCPTLFVQDAVVPNGHCTPWSFDHESLFLAYGARCTFACKYGYQLKGCKERVCQLDKSWSENSTSCERMYEMTLFTIVAIIFFHAIMCGS